MFDEQTTQPAPPKNLPTEPVDMFEAVEKEEKSIPDALSAGLLKKKEEEKTPAESVMQPVAYKADSPIVGKLIMVVFVGILLAGLGFGGWFFYNKAGKMKSTDTQPLQQQKPVDLVEEEQVQEKAPEVPVQNKSTDIPSKMNNDQILFGEPVDSDKDGLDDIREKELGTNANDADTDADGLNDGDEVIIWKTNPLNPDTDNDTYVDGKEVKNGYSPLGPGKLFSATSTP